MDLVHLYGYESREVLPFGRYNDQERLYLVSFSLEGHVLNWFNGEMETDPFVDWPQFKRCLVHRFNVKIEEEPAKRLFAITQTGSIVDYVNEFEELKSMVTGVDNANLEHIFYNGLKPEMKEVIKMKEPRGKRAHIAAVLKIEDSAFCKSMAAAQQHNYYGRSTPYVPLKSSLNYNTNKNTVQMVQTNAQSSDKATEGTRVESEQKGEESQWKGQLQTLMDLRVCHQLRLQRSVDWGCVIIFLRSGREFTSVLTWSFRY